MNSSRTIPPRNAPSSSEDGETFQIGDYLYNVYGGTRRPYLYKTLKNASKNATNPGVFAHGIKRPSERHLHKVMLFDPSRLLEVTEDTIIETLAKDREDDLVIAERQIQLWSDRLVELQAKARADATFNDGLPLANADDT
jgi:hypothetical protein